MASLTRWVLAHKRIVVDLLGRADARRHGLGRLGDQSAQTEVLGARQGRLDHQPADRSTTSTAPAATPSPLLPVVTLPAGQVGRLAGRAARELRGVEARLAERSAGHARGGLREHAQLRLRSPTTGARRSSSPTRRPTPTDPSATTPKRPRRPIAALAGATVAGAPVHLTGYRRADGPERRRQRAGRAASRRCSAGFGALLVLAFVFGSFLALVPIMMAIVSILTTFLVVWGLTTVTEVSPIVQFLIALIGLGVSIDYALLVVVRWREERAHGLEGDAAVAARDGDRRAARSCSAARPSRSACSRWSRCRCRSCARSATAAC